MLIMPCWPGAAHPLGQADASLPLLVELLLLHAGPDASASASATAAAAAGAAPADGAGPEAPKGGAPAAQPVTEVAAAAAPTVDVRRMSAVISRQLAEAAAKQLEQAQAAGKLSREQAAEAVAVVEAAVSGSAAVAAAAAQTHAGAAPPSRPARPGEEGGAEQEPPAPSRKRQQPDADIGSPAAAAPAEAGERGPEQQPRLSKRQRRELAREQQEAQQQAARTLVLAAVSQLGASGGRATLADVNAYLLWAWDHLGRLAFGKTAKAALVAAIEAGLVEPAGAGTAAAVAGLGPEAAAVAAASAPAGEERRFVAGRAYCLSLVGAAAAPQPQHVAELSAFSRQFRSQAELGAALQAGRASLQAQQQEAQQQQLEGSGPAQQQQQQQVQPEGGQQRHQGGQEEEQKEQQQGQQERGADGAEGTALPGFFWERQAEPRAQAQARGQGQAQAWDDRPAATQAPAPAVPPPVPAPADLAALQSSVLLHAVSVLQRRRGVPADSIERWVLGQLQARHVGLAVLAAEGSKASKAQARTLRSLLQLGLRACEKVGGCTGGSAPGRASVGRPAGRRWLRRRSAPARSDVIPQTHPAATPCVRACLLVECARMPGK